MKNLLLILLLLAACAAHAQSTNLVVLNTKVGDERAPVLTWQSESNAIYRIDYAGVVANTNTQWKLLYDDYPSHGTNTFWMDSGYSAALTEIPHPKRMGTRFYRVVKTGTNTAAPPYVRVTSPASNDVLTGEITVSVMATTSLAAVSFRLFVDGQEQYPSEDGTNFVINTCEWANGPHVMYAVAKADSELGGVFGTRPAFTRGKAVSPYIPIIFDNYVSQLYFTEPFFEPTLGQTQTVTAVFAQYSSWAAKVLNEDSNVVHTVTNSGYTMRFDWDGTGDGGTNLPNGVYYVLVEAAQVTAPAPGSGGGGANDPLPGPGGTSMQAGEQGQKSVAWYPTSPIQAALAGWDSYYLVPPPMPPVKIEGKWYSWEALYGPITPVQVPLGTTFLQNLANKLTAQSETMMTANAAAGAGAGAAMGPTKPPVKPIKGSVGTFGVAYIQYLPNGASGLAAPSSGLVFPLQTKISLETGNQNTTWTFNPISQFKALSEGFANKMKSKGWKASFIKANDEVRVQDLKKTSLGGSNIFNTVNLGFFMSHGAYGNSLDYTSEASQSYQTYFPIWTSTNNVNNWIRFSEFHFGSTNLKWMAFLACNTLRDANYDSMNNRGVLPFDDKLHLFCSGKTILYAGNDVGFYFAKHMTKGGFLTSAQTVKRSWFLGGKDGYKNGFGITNTVVFRVAGHQECFGDTLKNSVEPSTQDIVKEDQQVYPPVNIP